jgi:glycosyltransferase involved in cell wall biosynthesis
LLLALGLRDRGHENFLIGPPASPLVERARRAGLAVAAIGMAADWDVNAVRRIRARMRAWRVDIVHAHDARAHALAMIALLGRNQIPLVVTRRVAFTPRSVRIKYGHRVTRFIAISKAVRDVMVSGGIDASRITVIHSGISAPRDGVEPRNWRSELAWPDDSVICGIVGAMTAEKGIGSLAAICSALTPRSRRRARVVLLGGTPANIQELGGVPVHSAGFVEDIEPAIAGLEVLWHPSRNEGLGTSVIDAMSLGVPPVAFSVGGVPEVIEHGESGLLVPAGDIGGFAAASSELIEQPHLRQRLADGARTRAKIFGADEMTKRTEAVYYELHSG